MDRESDAVQQMIWVHAVDVAKALFNDVIAQQAAHPLGGLCYHFRLYGERHRLLRADPGLAVDDAEPQPGTLGGVGAAAVIHGSSAVWRSSGHMCEPGIRRVAPLSAVKSVIAHIVATPNGARGFGI